MTTLGQRELRVRASAGLGAFVVAVNLTTANVAIADMKTDFRGAAFSTFGWVLSTYTILFGAALVPAGRLADRLGRRRVMGVGLVVFSVGSFVAAAAPTIGVVIAGRALQGVGAAGIVPSLLGLLLDATSVDRRTNATAFFSTVSSLGGAFGPTVGALLIEASSWRAAFWMCPIVAALSWLVGRSVLPTAPVVIDGEARRPDLLGSLLVVVAISSLSLGITQARSWGWVSIRVIAALTVAVVVVPLFLRRSARHPSPVMPLHLFRHRDVAIADLASLLYGVATGAIIFVNVQFLRTIWHTSLFIAGLGSLPMAGSSVLVAPFAGRLGQRYGLRRVAVAGTALFTVGVIVWRVSVGSEKAFVAHFVPGGLLTGIGMALAYPMIAVGAVRGVAGRDLSVATAVNRTMLQVGNALGIAVAVALLGGAETLHDFRVTWTVLASMALATVLTVSRLTAHSHGELVATVAPVVGPDRSGSEVPTPATAHLDR